MSKANKFASLAQSSSSDRGEETPAQTPTPQEKNKKKIKRIPYDIDAIKFVSSKVRHPRFKQASFYLDTDVYETFKDKLERLGMKNDRASAIEVFMHLLNTDQLPDDMIQLMKSVYDKYNTSDY